MGWHLLETLLQQVGEHSTLVGKFWITATFIFRFVIVASVGDAVYSDEQSDFTCNTLQPGCENVCFNRFSPISHLRFWAAQIVAVCTPSIVFIVFSAHMLLKIPQEEAQEFDDGEDISQIEKNMLPPPVSQPGSPKKGKGGKTGGAPRTRVVSRSEKPNDKIGMVRGFANPPATATRLIEEIKAEDEVDGTKDGDSADETVFDGGDEEKALSEINRKLALLDDLAPSPQNKKEKRIKKQIQLVYTVALLLRTGLEAVFIWLQYQLYGLGVPELYRCSRWPCPNSVDCFASRPKEKTIFLWFMFVVSSICLTLSVIEIKYLGFKKLGKILCSGSDVASLMDDKCEMDGEKFVGIDHDSKTSRNDSYFRVIDGPTPSAPPAEQNDLYNVVTCPDKKTSDRDSIGFSAIGELPSYPIPGYPHVHRYGMLLNATPPPPSPLMKASYL